MEKIGFWYLDLRETTISKHLIDTVKKQKESACTVNKMCHGYKLMNYKFIKQE